MEKEKTQSAKPGAESERRARKERAERAAEAEAKAPPAEASSERRPRSERSAPAAERPRREPRKPAPSAEPEARRERPAARSYSPEETSAAEKAQATAPLDGSDRGVAVAYDGAGRFEVGFAYARKLAGIVGAIPGAAFDREDKVWKVPVQEYSALKEVAEQMREARVELDRDHAEIRDAAAKALPDARISNAMVKEGERSFGVILAVNENYVAQKAGATRVLVHDREALKFVPEVGQDKAIAYDKSGRASGVDRARGRDAAQNREAAPAM